MNMNTLAFLLNTAALVAFYLLGYFRGRRSLPARQPLPARLETMMDDDEMDEADVFKARHGYYPEDTHDAPERDEDWYNRH